MQTTPTRLQHEHRDLPGPASFPWQDKERGGPWAAPLHADERITFPCRPCTAGESTAAAGICRNTPQVAGDPANLRDGHAPVAGRCVQLSDPGQRLLADLLAAHGAPVPRATAVLEQDPRGRHARGVTWAIREVDHPGRAILHIGPRRPHRPRVRYDADDSLPDLRPRLHS